MKVPKKIMEAMERYINDSLLPVCYDLYRPFDSTISYEEYCHLVLDGLEKGKKE